MSEKLPEILKPESGCIPEDILFGYAEGKLPADEVRRVEEHLADCDFCSDALEGIMMADLEKSKAAIQEIRNKIHERATVRKIFPLRRVMQIAAVFVLLAVSGWFVNLMIQKPAEQIFTDQFQPYPAPQNEKSIQSVPPPVSENKISGDENKEHSAPLTSSNATPGAEKKQQAEKKSSEAPVTTIQQDEDSPAPAMTESADALAEENVIEQDKNKDSALSFSKSEDKVSKSARGNTNQERSTPSMNEVVTTDAISSADQMNVEDFNKGMAYYKGNQYAEAIAEFQLVLKQEPNHAEANFYSGVSSLARNNPDEALKYFKKTDSKGNPFYEATLWYQALSYINMGDKKQAKNLLEKVIELDGEYKARAEETLKQL